MKTLKEIENEIKRLETDLNTIKEKFEKEQEQKNDISKDPIFLLSVEEYKKYKDKIPNINCWWWLRSSGDYSYQVVGVDEVGSVSSDDNAVYYDYDAVRPTLKTSNLKPFEAIKLDGIHIFFCGITWVKIDEDLYIAEVPIAFRRFDEKSNDYATSEIRKFLLNWYEERKGW